MEFVSYETEITIWLGMFDAVVSEGGGRGGGICRLNGLSIKGVGLGNIIIVSTIKNKQLLKILFPQNLR